MGFELLLTPIYESRNDARQDLFGKRFSMCIGNFLDRIKIRRSFPIFSIFQTTDDARAADARFIRKL